MTKLKLLTIIFCLTGLAFGNVIKSPDDIIASHPRLYFDSTKLAEICDIVANGDADFESIRSFVDRRIDEPDNTENTLRGNYPYTIFRSAALVAAITGDSNYINTAKHYLLDILILIDPSQNWDTGMRYRLMCFAVGYDWLYPYLSSSEKSATRQAIYDYLYYGPFTNMWQDPNFVGGHSRLGNIAALAACLAVYREESRFDSVMNAVYSNWVDGYNPVLKYVGTGGGHHMGWMYGASYSTVDPYLMWFSATGEMWNEEHLYDAGFFLIYGANSLKAPAFGDCWALGVNNGEWIFKIATSAGLRKNPYSEAFYQQTQSFHNAWGPFRFARLITKDTSVPPAPLNSLPLAREFPGSGFVIVRDSWDSTATILTFKSTPFYSYNHHHRDENSFIINHKGPLLIDAGHYDSYGSLHFKNFYSRTIAHNSLIVYKSNEQIPKADHNNDGGQKLEPWDREPDNLAALQGQNLLEGVEKFSQNQNCAWIRGNASSAYDSTKLTTYLRDVIFAGSIRGWSHPVIFVADRVELPTARTPKILWQVAEAPAIQTDYAHIHNANGGHGRLEFLKPENMDINIIGDDESCWTVNEQIYAPTEERGGVKTWGRIEVATESAVTNQTFITLISLDEQQVTEARLAPAVLLEGTSWIGVRILNTFFAVITDHTNEISVTPEEGDGMVECFVASAQPNTAVNIRIGTTDYAVVADSEGLAVGELAVGELVPTTVDDGKLSYTLCHNYPNPFNPQTTISYQLPVKAHTTLKIYNTLGQEIRTLINEYKSAGNYSVIWDGKDNTGRQVSTGIYFYHINIGEDFNEIRKMLMIK